MKEMLILFTKNDRFIFNEDAYKQTDEVAMGFLLGSVLADIFMDELENNIVPVSRERKYGDCSVFENGMLMIPYVS